MLILDTNVLSELRKVPLGKANPNVMRWASGVEGGTLYLSVITIHELEIGILRLKPRNVVHSNVLRQWVDNHVIKTFDGRILPVDTSVARQCATFQTVKTRPWADAFIAATALVHGMAVITRNVRDFHGTGVPVLNP
jgi:hypothetical protein